MFVAFALKEIDFSSGVDKNTSAWKLIFRRKCHKKIMAQYSHLPIFAKTYEFIKSVYRIVGQFRKEYKYSLGAELQKIIWEVMDEIIKTNSLADNEKREGIEKVSRLFDRFKIRFRLAYEIGLMSDQKFGIAQKEMEEIGKMIGGWKKWAGGG